jgi:hypothetical protein
MIVALPPVPVAAASLSGHAISPAFYEGCLTALVIGLAYAFPRLGSSWFRSIERRFMALARKQSLAVATVGLAAFFLRLAILPFCPIPLPFVPDDFSFLLGADTFAQGHLTNPTPAMWTHFESIHITMVPSYTTMYFPMTSLVMAVGKVVAGNAWFGLLAATALMCAAICWMLQAWLPPGWALLGGFVAVLRIGLFSYWINSFNGGGAVAALGGALVLGALPRLMRTLRLRDGMLLSLGISILMLSRPYEGLLLCLPIVIVLARWIVARKNPFGKLQPSNTLMIRQAALPIILLIAAGAWLAYYDYRVFGHATTLPYTVDRATYAVTPYFVWQNLRPFPAYRHEALRIFYTINEVEGFSLLHDKIGFWVVSISKLLMTFIFFAGFLLLPTMMMVRRVFRDRRVRFILYTVIFCAAGMAIQIFLIPHYLAPFTAAFYAIGLQAMRHLRLWSPSGNPVGLTLSRLMITGCILLAGMRLFPAPLHYSLEKWPPQYWLIWWFGPGHFGTDRLAIESQLRQQPGNQLVIVKYASDHNVLNEWVYNAPDIDHSKIIWAHDMKSDENQALIDHYNDRQVWLLELNDASPSLSHYPAAAKGPAR